MLSRLLAGTLLLGTPLAGDQAPPYGKEEIHTVISRGMGGFRRCYERLDPDAGFPSRVEVGFTIGSAGLVTATRFRCTPPCAALSKCLDAAARRLRFPPVPDGGTVEVSWPWNVDATGP